MHTRCYLIKNNLKNLYILWGKKRPRQQRTAKAGLFYSNFSFFSYFYSALFAFCERVAIMDRSWWPLQQYSSFFSHNFFILPYRHEGSSRNIFKSRHFPWINSARSFNSSKSSGMTAYFFSPKRAGNIMSEKELEYFSFFFSLDVE